MKKPAAVGYPQPTAPASESRVLLREVGREKPATVKRMLSDIYRQNRTDVKGIRTKKYGIGVEVLGIYVFNDVIYLSLIHIWVCCVRSSTPSSLSSRSISSSSA